MSMSDEVPIQKDSGVMEDNGEYTLLFARGEENQKLRLSDFEVINLIGKGSISNVYLVVKRSTGQAYAMKCIQKSLILEEDLFKNT